MKKIVFILWLTFAQYCCAGENNPHSIVSLLNLSQGEVEAIFKVHIQETDSNTIKKILTKIHPDKLSDDKQVTGMEFFKFIKNCPDNLQLKNPTGKTKLAYQNRFIELLQTCDATKLYEDLSIIVTLGNTPSTNNNHESILTTLSTHSLSDILTKGTNIILKEKVNAHIHAIGLSDQESAIILKEFQEKYKDNQTFVNIVIYEYQRFKRLFNLNRSEKLLWFDNFNILQKKLLSNKKITEENPEYQLTKSDIENINICLILNRYNTKWYQKNNATIQDDFLFAPAEMTALALRAINSWATNMEQYYLQGYSFKTFFTNYEKIYRNLNQLLAEKEHNLALEDQMPLANKIGNFNEENLSDFITSLLQTENKNRILNTFENIADIIVECLNNNIAPHVLLRPTGILKQQKYTFSEIVSYTQEYKTQYQDAITKDNRLEDCSLIQVAFYINKKGATNFNTLFANPKIPDKKSFLENFIRINSTSIDTYLTTIISLYQKYEQWYQNDNNNVDLQEICMQEELTRRNLPPKDRERYQQLIHTTIDKLNLIPLPENKEQQLCFLENKKRIMSEIINLCLLPQEIHREEIQHHWIIKENKNSIFDVLEKKLDILISQETLSLASNDQHVQQRIDTLSIKADFLGFSSKNQVNKEGHGTDLGRESILRTYFHSYYISPIQRYRYLISTKNTFLSFKEWLDQIPKTTIETPSHGLSYPGFDNNSFQDIDINAQESFLEPLKKLFDDSSLTTTTMDEQLRKKLRWSGQYYTEMVGSVYIPVIAFVASTTFETLTKKIINDQASWIKDEQIKEEFKKTYDNDASLFQKIKAIKNLLPNEYYLAKAALKVAQFNNTIDSYIKHL